MADLCAVAYKFNKVGTALRAVQKNFREVKQNAFGTLHRGEGK